jgi:hypothetical protein
LRLGSGEEEVKAIVKSIARMMPSRSRVPLRED